MVTDLAAATLWWPLGLGRSPAFRSCSRERVPGVFRSPAALRTHVPRSPVQDEGGARGLCPPVRPLGPESLTAAPRAGCSVPALAPRAAPLRGDPRFCVFPELRLPPFKTLKDSVQPGLHQQVAGDST